MRIQELLRNTPSKGELMGLFRKNDIIKIDTDVGVYRTTASKLAMGIIAHRKYMRARTREVNPVIMLGYLGSEETIEKLLTDPDVQLIIKTKKYDDPSVQGSFNPNTKEVSIADTLAQTGANQVIAKITAHEYAHKGLNMASSIPAIFNTIKQVSKLPTNPPFDAWGVNPNHVKQTLASEKRFSGTQYATLEHLMIYGYMNARNYYIKLHRDSKGGLHPTLDANKNLQPDPTMWQSVPGFEDMKTIDDAFEKALAIFNVIGRGVEQYLLRVAKEANNIPARHLDKLILQYFDNRLG